MKLGAGIDASGSRNRVESVRVERNAVRSTMIGKGVFLWAGLGHPDAVAPATGNRISGVTIKANRITTGNAGRHRRPIIEPRAEWCFWAEPPSGATV